MASNQRYIIETVESRAGQTVLEVLADVQYPTVRQARREAKAMQKPGLLVRIRPVCSPSACHERP